MSKSDGGGLAQLAGTVAPRVLLDAIETSQLLSDLGVPHALVGGLAVGLHGHPRATKDVDFMVSEEAFETTEPLLTYRPELADAVTVGEVDLLAVPPGRPALRDALELPSSGAVPVIDVRGLVLMKLDAGRPQDIADVHALLDAGASADAVGAYLVAAAPDLADRFAALLDERDTGSPRR